MGARLLGDTGQACAVEIDLVQVSFQGTFLGRCEEDSGCIAAVIFDPVDAVYFPIAMGDLG